MIATRADYLIKSTIIKDCYGLPVAELRLGMKYWELQFSAFPFLWAVEQNFLILRPPPG